MAIRRSELDPYSSVSGMVNPQIVRLPRSNPGGVTDMTPVALGDKLVMSGSYCQNISTDTFSCDLRLATCLIITSAANADTWSIFVRGRDQFGQPVSELMVKTRTNMQNGRRSNWAYSRIDEARIVAASTIGQRLRVGLMYGAWGFNVVDFGSRITAGADIARSIPLPFKPKSAGDVSIRFKGYEPAASQFVTLAPVANNTTFTSTTATSSSTWDVTGVVAGDLAYTRDGFVGIITSAAANAITVGSWFSERTGIGGATPANVSGGGNTPTAVMVIRSISTGNYDAATLGGMIPGLPIASLAANVDTGVQSGFSTFGYLDNRLNEPLLDTVFEVYCRVTSKP